jgi:AcrR family transcriptional regulator
MASSPPQAHINPPKQNRSRRTLERIVAASFELLATEGPEGLTVHKVVAKAESSVGSFYARFKGKDDLLDYLGERVWTEALDRWNQALQSEDWEQLELGALVRACVGLLADAQRSRSVYLKAIDQMPGRRAHAYEKFRSDVLSGVAGLLLERAEEIDHEDPRRAVRLGLSAVLGVLDAEARAVRDRLPRDVMVDECTVLLLGYLSRTDAARDTGTPPDFFDVWA